MNIKVVTIPENKEDKNISEKIRAIVEDRNKSIAKSFGVEPRDIGVNLYYSADKLRSRIDANGDALGIYCGYKDGEDDIGIVHPNMISTIFGDNLDRQLVIMVDYTLVLLYMCQIYYPQKSDFKLYYKYLSDSLARIVSGNYNKASVEFNIKHFTDFKKYKKDEELMMAFYVMSQKGSLDFIFEYLNKIVEDLDIKKSIMRIYKKEFKELISLYQKEMIVEEKKLKKI
jgi:hypothetical protein